MPSRFCLAAGGEIHHTASYVARISAGEITSENAEERKRIMEIRRANDNIEDFSAVEAAIEEELDDGGGGGVLDDDNGDPDPSDILVGGHPVPPENTLGVREKHPYSKWRLGADRIHKYKITGLRRRL